MPIGDIAGEALGAVVRLVGRMLVEVVFELVIQGAGYLLLRLFRPHSKPSDEACAIVGLLFWLTAIVVGLGLYRHLAAS